LYSETSFTLFFNDGLSEYKTVVYKEGIDLAEFRVTNLAHAVRLLGVDNEKVNLKVSVGD